MSATVIESFKNAMLEAGIQPPEIIIADGQLHRFKIDGKLNGAYLLHLSGITPAGYFEDFKQGIKRTWKLAGEFRRLTDSERQAFKVLADKKAYDARMLIESNQRQAAIKAGFIWSNSEEAPANHPYLIKKRIQFHGVRLYKGALVIPIYSPESQLFNLQFIDETGNKRFLLGGRKRGCFSAIGTPTDTILIAEGWATGASLFEYKGFYTVVALDAGNLEAVAVEISKLYPKAKIIVCGDHDESRIGEIKARKAALAVGCGYIIPPIAGMDWNDFINMEAV